MLVVAAGMVAHSLRYHSQTITTLAFLLALLTVGISDVTVFSLVAGASAHCGTRRAGGTASAGSCWGSSG